MSNPAAEAPSPTFLVVEDNRKVRESIGDLLKLWGVHVVEASNGFQALRALEKGLAPAGILLDLELPLMSGWHLHVTLQNDPLYAPIPVVIVTAHEMGDSHLPGVHAILQKPVSADSLLKTVQSCVAEGQPVRR
jgi:CheY-like chemotaxis protein